MSAQEHFDIDERISLARLFKSNGYEDNQYLGLMENIDERIGPRSPLNHLHNSNRNPN